MPLNLPDKLPAIELLKEENIFVIDNSRASAQDIRPLKIVILHLMPLKITTERTKAVATPRMVAVWASQRGISRQNRPAIAAPTRGASGTAK